MNIKEFIYLILIFSVGTINAQDIHFSQFNEQPALLNPALTGATAASRAAIAYRNQWRSVTSPYVTSGASFETRFNSTNWQQVDKFRSMTFKQRTAGRLAAGISVYKDNAGDGNMGNLQGNFSLASFVPIGKKSFLSLGLQASYIQRKLNNNELIFPSQYNGTGYDAGLSSGEQFQTLTYSYADFAGGLLWSYGQNDKSLLGKRQLKANLGFSLYRINKVKQRFLADGQSRRTLKYVAHGDLLVSLSNPDYAVAPSYMLQFYGKSNEIMAGMLLKRYFKIDSKYTGIMKRSSLGVGAYYRNQDAAILYFAVEIKEQVNIGLSYDFNISRLRVGTNSRGGFELTMRYTPPASFLYQKKAASASGSK